MVILTIQADLGVDSQALLTAPGAGKWYRSSGAVATQNLYFNLAAGSVLEWLPQETILFDGARANIDMDVELAQGAAFIGWEILCLGRAAAGERFDHGHLCLAVRINLDGKPLWREFGHLRGADPLMQSPAGLAACSVVGTLLVAGKTIPAEVLSACRALVVDKTAGEHSGITVLPNLLVARYLGHKSESAAWVSLLVAFLSIMRMLFPAVDMWSEGRALLFGALVVALIASGFIVAIWMSKATPADRLS